MTFTESRRISQRNSNLKRAQLIETEIIDEFNNGQLSVECKMVIL